MKKKPLLVGIAIGVLARPVIKRVYRKSGGFRYKIESKIYQHAIIFVQNFDARNP